MAIEDGYIPDGMPALDTTEFDHDPEAQAQRRAAEKALIRDIDTRNIDDDGVWFLVAEVWLYKWRRFIEVPGEPAPGPIVNHVLLQDDGVTPKRGLRKIEQYRGVNAAVWDFLQGVYGGGPPLPRMALDIYDTAPVPRREPRVSAAAAALALAAAPRAGAAGAAGAAPRAAPGAAPGAGAGAGAGARRSGADAEAEGAAGRRRATSAAVSAPLRGDDPAVRLRAAEEKRHIKAVDARHKASTNAWMLVDETWLSQWRDFVQLPMLPPGPITNHTLLLSDGVTPRPGLKKIKHYRGVNEATWLYLHSVYGGGPSLPRMTLDIYDTTPIKYLDGRGERK